MVTTILWKNELQDLEANEIYMASNSLKGWAWVPNLARPLRVSTLMHVLAHQFLLSPLWKIGKSGVNLACGENVPIS
jgi:hypothetical protein